VGRHVSDLFAEGFDTHFRAMYDNLLSGRTPEENFQTRWVTREGRAIWVNGRSNLLQWQGRLTVLLTARDITEAKLREISMQEEAENLRRENVTLRSSMRDRYRLGDIIGKSPAMQRVYQLILNAAASHANTIIYGESGTGKELTARAIHNMSSRAGKPLVPVNCAAIPENLLESEFFGHVKGAFTGAHTNKRGYLDRANGGTLFLDEVGALSPSLQAKLLRAIEGGGYSPVGSNMVKNSDFRIIAATNVDLMEQSKSGLFRQDFFFRIYIIPIHLPPLRKRKEDIPLLVEHYLQQYSGGKQAPTLPGRVLEALLNYEWPGNVRELQNVLQRYLTVGRLDFMPQLDRSDVADAEAAGLVLPDRARDFRLKEVVDRVEKAMIQETLGQYRANKSRAAAALGVTRKTLARKMRQLGLP
jgi:transcriptional regulator with PAS, ATPase and Fis domain